VTKAEKALAIERVGAMVWGGAMDRSAANWFVCGLYKVDWSEAESMIRDAMAQAMVEEVDRNLAKIGDKHAERQHESE
jgi:hypothetical protein